MSQRGNHSGERWEVHCRWLRFRVLLSGFSSRIRPVLTIDPNHIALSDSSHCSGPRPPALPPQSSLSSVASWKRSGENCGIDILRERAAQDWKRREERSSQLESLSRLLDGGLRKTGKGWRWGHRGDSRAGKQGRRGAGRRKETEKLISGKKRRKCGRTKPENHFSILSA